jgi:hypothetical protein
MPTHVFEEAILQTSKIHNLFTQYPNNKYFSALEFVENGEKIHKFFYYFNK